MDEEMNLIESVRRIFTTQPSVESLSAAADELNRALETAKATSADRWRVHNSRAVEFISMPDEAPAKRSRQSCDEADRRVADLEAALRDTRSRLEATRTARSASDAAAAWQASAELVSARGEAMARLQAHLVEIAEEHRKVLALTEDVWQSLPVKPQNRPPTYTAGDMSARMQIFLAGASAGRLGSTTLNAFVASQRPDLVSVDHEAALMLLALRPEVVTS